MTFIQNHLNHYTVSQLCSALKFPRSTYYKALVRVPSNRQEEYEEFGRKVKQAYDESRQRYGAVKIDPGASEVNQLNRIKLMLATAQKNLKAESSREDRGNGRRPVTAYSPCLGTMSHT